MLITQYRWHNDNVSQTKNAKRNAEIGLRALLKISKNTILGYREIKACQSVIQAATKEYLYVCSLGGWKIYAAGLGFVRKLFGWRSATLAVNPKHIVRCAVTPSPHGNNRV